ncbi:MAG TPA: glycosyltransferase [Bacilli bacterium]|nr:glycosyltransferase [Bacilli bacterium]
MDVPEKWKKKISSFGGMLFTIAGRNRHPFRYASKLKKIISNGKYDAVHIHGNSATMAVELFAAKRAKCPIRIVHSRNTKCDHRIIDKILRPYFYHTATDFFACGEKAGQWLFPNREFTVINNGNDIDKNSFSLLDRNKYREDFSIADKTIVLLNIGLFVDQKNHVFLVEVFNKLCQVDQQNDYKLVLVGTGPLLPMIKEKVITYGLSDKVIFLQNRDDIAQILSMSDIFLFPSLFEGLPNVVVEAQISNLQCLISNRITGEVKLTPNVYFLPIEASDVSKWVQEIIKSAPLINQREATEEKNLAMISEKGFDIRDNAKRLQSIYLSLLNKEQL